MSAPTIFRVGSTLTTDTSHNPAFKIIANASAPAGQPLFCQFDYAGAPEWFTGNSSNKVSTVFGDMLAATNQNTNPYGPNCGFDGRGGRTQPGAVQFPLSRSLYGGLRIFSGTGLPTAVIVTPCIQGDIYLRVDTPTTSNQRVYQCTTAGTPGTWTARL